MKNFHQFFNQKDIICYYSQAIKKIMQNSENEKPMIDIPANIKSFLIVIALFILFKYIIKPKSAPN